ncbi:hypothetical protein PAHAL_5G173200 [Panicum hallii]|uniref:Uncharacterized protein n=1 Tax=Panicum hallii TaxID=206008 RepID=A0A2S3HS50_9POAL|nr:hypothetical protein PAHAL_5G173200 [Panicum hallii]
MRADGQHNREPPPPIMAALLSALVFGGDDGILRKGYEQFMGTSGPTR